MIVIVILGLGLMAIALVSVQTSLSHAVARTVQQDDFSARQVAASGAAQAITRLRRGGAVTPLSGGGTTATWVNFSRGQFYYYSVFDAATEMTRIRAWGRIPTDSTVITSGCNSNPAPDSVSFDGTGWFLKGLEIAVKNTKYIPDAPIYFGNGGVERPLGGFEWSSGVNPTDPSTWTTVQSSPSSYQASSVPFEVSALNHPHDYLYNAGSPAPATGPPHPYKIWQTQNAIGQFNVAAWFANSAGSGNDPTSSVSPPPTASYYEMSDLKSPSHAYAVDPTVPDVQTFATELWHNYGNVSGTTNLSGGNRSGTYGTLANPGITFVTGTLNVESGTSFKGAGVLVIRDDYDPAVQTNNTPSTRAGLTVAGNFEWTGLVIVSGWAPTISVSSDSGASATIVGALFGEDSVQSGGETSLDSATITLQVQRPFRVLYSNALFQPGGLVYSFLPLVKKQIVATWEI